MYEKGAFQLEFGTPLVFRYPGTPPAVGSSDADRSGNMVWYHSGLQRAHALESCSRVVAGRVLAG